MADHPIDIIIRARDQASKAIGNVNRSLSNMGRIAKQGAATAVRNIARIGAAAGIAGAGLLALGIKNGVQSLADLETAVTSVDGAIVQMGLTGSITGKQIATWANEIEAATSAAFDDKAIAASTATLIRYGKVTEANIRPAMEVMTDLAAKTGSVESASSLLAKALADPAKAAGKLARVGVVLTKQQQKQIDSSVKAGKTAQAQGVLLEALSQTTKNAARDSVGPYGDALNTMADATEDAQRALGEGFLPVIQRAAGWIQKTMANPATISTLRSFGNSLADAFDEAISFAQSIPWSAIGDGLSKAAGFARGLFDAFRSMPPEVQSTLVALAGLDALSGGAIHNIVGELGKGLIKGILGITAAVVNINAASVNGGGGVPGVTGTGGKLGGIKGALSTGAKIIVPLGVGLAIAEGIKEASGMSDEELTNRQSNNYKNAYGGGQKDPARAMGEIKREQVNTTGAVDAVAQKQAESTMALANVERTTSSGLSTTARAAQFAGLTAAMATAISATRIVSAINGIHIPAPVVSSTTITYNNTQQNRNGRNSSRIKDDGGSHHERTPV